MSRYREEAKYFAGLVSSVCLALMGAGIVPHPYDKWVMGLGLVGASVSTFHMSPPSHTPPQLPKM